MHLQIKRAVNGLGLFVNKNSPSILISMGIGGLVGSIVMAIQATPKAIDRIENELYGTHKDHLYALSVDERIAQMPLKQRLELVWPVYVPTASTALLSIVAIFAGNRIHLRRAAALASVYTLTENALKTYQAKVLETVGENKFRQIQGDIAEDAINDNPPTEENTYNVGGGRELCYEMATGRYFQTDAEKIQAAVNKFNHELMSEQVKTLNELYYDLGLPFVELGNKVGWEVDNGLVDIVISARVADNSERPCLVLDFINRPQYLWK